MENSISSQKPVSSMRKTSNWPKKAYQTNKRFIWLEIAVVVICTVVIIVLTIIVNRKKTPTNNDSFDSTTTKGSITTTSVVPQKNLLVNPGGEDGVLTPWTVGGTSNPMLDNGTFNADYLPHSGMFQFSGHTGLFGTLSQTVAIGNGTQGITAAQIDTGNLDVTIQFWSRSFVQTPNDGAAVSLHFLDAFGNILGNVTSPEQASGGTWISYTSSYPIPSETRSIQYNMIFILHAGKDIDSYIDDNSMIID